MRNIADYEREYIEHPFERYSEKYRRRIVRKTIKKYAKKGKIIVEIGCGRNPLFIDYGDEYSFIVIEPSQYCFDNAMKLSLSFEHTQCYQGCFEDIAGELGECKADIVICSGLLHEVEEPERLLNGIHHICHKNTIVHVNVPNAFSLHRLLALEAGLMQDVHQFSESNRKLQQHMVFDLKSLKELVDKQGFRVLDEGAYFLKPFTHWQMQQCMDMDILNEDILDGLNQLTETYFKEYGSEIYLNLQIKRDFL